MAASSSGRRSDGGRSDGWVEPWWAEQAVDGPGAGEEPAVVVERLAVQREGHALVVDVQQQALDIT